MSQIVIKKVTIKYTLQKKILSLPYSFIKLFIKPFYHVIINKYWKNMNSFQELRQNKNYHTTLIHLCLRKDSQNTGHKHVKTCFWIGLWTTYFGLLYWQLFFMVFGIGVETGWAKLGFARPKLGLVIKGHGPFLKVWYGLLAYSKA